MNTIKIIALGVLVALTGAQCWGAAENIPLMLPANHNQLIAELIQVRAQINIGLGIEPHIPLAINNHDPVLDQWLAAGFRANFGLVDVEHPPIPLAIPMDIVEPVPMSIAEANQTVLFVMLN